MKKNVASQVVGAQMITAADGTAFTGSVTVSVTGDGGTQATGSVGSGACTHEGNGFHTYAPAQAETNYDHVAFTFTGTGAIPVTVQIYTTFPQAGDSFARLGAPAGASVSADIAAVPTAAENRTEMDSNSTQLAAIVADTNELQTDDIPTTLATLATAAELAKVPKSDGTTSWNATALAAINAQCDTALSDYDAPTKGELDSGLAGLNDPAAAAIADAVWDEALSGHVGTGSTGEALNAAGAAGDPWTTALPGAYGAGSAGYIIGNNINAPIGTVDTVVDGIKAVTDNLPDSGALTTLLSNVAAILADTNELQTDDLPTTLATIAGYIDTEVAAIKAKTDNLPTDPADQSAVEAAILSAWTTQLTESYAANGVAPTPAQALFAIHQMLMNFAISGTSYTVKQLDESTTAFVVTLDDGTTPTAATRS